MLKVCWEGVGISVNLNFVQTLNKNIEIVNEIGYSRGCSKPLQLSPWIRHNPYVLYRSAAICIKRYTDENNIIYFMTHP